MLSKIVYQIVYQIVAALFKRRDPSSSSSSYRCVQTPGIDRSTTLCRKKACLCSLCLEAVRPIPSSSDEFEDGCPAAPREISVSSTSSSCFPTGRRRRKIRVLAKRCLNCLMGYSADCLAVCCCPLSIPHFLFFTVPVLIYRRLRLRRKMKEISPYQKLGINPDELRKPKRSLLKDDDVPFVGFGGEHWEENFG